MPGARCTRGLVCKVAQRNAHTSIQVQRRQSGIPCAMVLRLMPRSCVRRICQNERTGGSDNCPSLDLSPIVLKGLESLSGSVGRFGVFLNPIFEPGPSKEGRG